MMIQTKLVKVCLLGRIPFSQAMTIQNRVAKTHLDEIAGRTITKGENTLLVLEHDPVYTIGIRTKGYSAEEEIRLKSLGADFVRTNRGGLITFHGPGQLVAYPILNLGHFHKSRSMKWYVCQLEQCVIKMCHHFGIHATTSSDTGVWINENKVAAIGIHGSRYITTHGIAINCDIDLDWFAHIVPCGLPEKGVTSISENLGRKTTVKEVIPKFLEAFKTQFQCELVFDEDSVNKSWKSTIEIKKTMTSLQTK